MQADRDGFEMAFLGSVLLDSDILMSSYLTEAMFSTYRRVFVILTELSSKARINADDIPMLIRGGIDGQTVAKLIQATPSSANWEYYQKGIFELWAESEIKSAYKLALSQGYPDCVDVVERTMTAVALRQSNAKSHKIKEVVNPAVDRIMERVRLRGQIPGVSWCMEEIDEATLGAQGGQLVVVGARPSQGKSALMAQLARKMARGGTMVGIVTIESSETELVIRMLGSDAGIDGRKLQTGMLGQSHLADLSQSAHRLLKDNIIIHDQPSIRLSQLQAVVRKMARDGAKVVFLDYLQLIRVPSKDKRSEEVGEASTALKALARELNICVVTMAQLGRDSDDRRPNMGDFQHSSQIEQDADQLWLLWHKQDNDGNFTDSRIILAKVRDGQVNISRKIRPTHADVLRDRAGQRLTLKEGEMDIQDELREAWEEIIPPFDDDESDIFGGNEEDREKIHFALGYLACKRRLGVSKPDRRVELLELAGFMAPIGTEMAKRFDPRQTADGFALVLSKALDVLTKQD